MFDTRLGSTWKKWDLHIHSKYSKENDAKLEVKDIFKQAIVSGIEVISITDHSNVDALDEIWEFWENGKIELSGNNVAVKDYIEFFPGVELKTNVGKRGVHIIAVFPKCIDGTKIDKSYLENQFLAKLECSTQDRKNKGNGNYDNGLFNIAVDFKKAAELARKNGGLIIAHAGDKTNGLEKEMAHAKDENNIQELWNSLGPEKEDLLREYIDICELPGNRGKQNHGEISFYLKKGKPSIISSDSHKSYEGKLYTWIKADPTIEGLRQIKYEPLERVSIDEVKPDQKEPYKVITKVLFENTDKFPQEIVINSNLAAIIGSRSSGKSALLNYIAHSINPDLTEKLLPKGPAANIKWENVDFDCHVEWSHGNSEDTGKIVFIPQGHLYKLSEDPEEITEKIKPVLFSKYPEIETKYELAKRNIRAINKRIEDNIRNYFENSEKITNVSNSIKNYGDKTAIEKAKQSYEEEVNKVKSTLNITDDEIVKYKAISLEISKKETFVEETTKNLENLKTEYYKPGTTEVVDFYVGFQLVPTINTLPESVQKKINATLASSKKDIVTSIEKEITEYKQYLTTSLTNTKKDIDDIKRNNSALIDKNKQSESLEKLVDSINTQEKTLKDIESQESAKTTIETKLQEIIKDIKSQLDARDTITGNLKESFSQLVQDTTNINFDIEVDFNTELLRELSELFNLKETTSNPFITEQGTIDVTKLRKCLNDFIQKMFHKDIKVKSGKRYLDVAIESLCFTEEFRFAATMENDKIGGFSPSSMTPGKQALFALSLLLDESSDTWPLLIDQPEDDLDSRSIYDSIVSFLKEKKRERQIIMVSHNANLVVGADAEQVIVANRHGSDRKNKNGHLFDYYSGSLENTKPEIKADCVLEKCGIREHTCEILEGGEEAFNKRIFKYSLQAKK